MREVGGHAVGVAGQTFEHLLRRQVPRARPGQRLDDIHRRAGARGFGAGGDRHALRHHPLQHDAVGEAGQRVVPDQQHPAGLEAGAEQPHDAVPHHIRHPGPDAIEDDEIGLGQRPRHRGLVEGRDIRLVEMQVRKPGFLGDFARLGDVRRLQVQAMHVPARIGSGQYRRGHAAAAADVDDRQPFLVRVPDCVLQGSRKAQPRRNDLLLEGREVTDIRSRVAVLHPAVHARRP